MSDVCPKCGSGEPRKEPAYGGGALSFSCGSVFRGEEELIRWNECERREIELLHDQLAQANERINELLSSRMDAAEAKISTTPAGKLLNAVADECHGLAVRRGKYPKSWDVWDGAKAVNDELMEWLSAALMDMGTASDDEFGDTLHAVLSVGHHMGYDIAEALRGAMERNRERAVDPK